MKNAEKFKQLRDKNIDLGIIGKGFISLYYNENIINYDIDLLKAKKYKIVELDGNFITGEKELHFELQDKLNLPDYYSENFDSLNDCLIDYEIHENGLVIIFRHLNNLDSRTLCMLLDVFVTRARQMFARGKKMLILVQVDNPKFNIVEPIGAVNFYLWNDQEWFEANRR